MGCLAVIAYAVLLQALSAAGASATTIAAVGVVMFLVVFLALMLDQPVD